MFLFMIMIFYGVMYSGVECVCGVTLSYDGVRTRDLWFTTHWHYQLNYEVKSVREASNVRTHKNKHKNNIIF